MAATNGETIVMCAVTGGKHTPTMSDALPATPEEIVAQAVAVAEAGASILHLHARDCDYRQAGARSGRLHIATPAEAREALALNGGGVVGF